MTLTFYGPVTGPRSETITWWRVRVHEGRLLLTFRRPSSTAPEAVILGPQLAATIEQDGRIVFDSRRRQEASA
ncbi:MAG TPA: hypothetical protein VF339_18690 [Gammaproteobacteria bacterium]